MKSTIKKLITFITKLESQIYIALYRIFKFRYKTVAIMLSRIPGYYGMQTRRAFYEKTLEKCGRNLNVHFGAYLVYPTIEIGDNCAIEEFSIVSDCKIGNDVILAARVSIMSGGNHHDVMDITTTFRESKSNMRKLIIGDNVWIGTHAVVLENISEHTVVAAASVVTRVYPAYSVIGGVPARIIKCRKDD